VKDPPPLAVPADVSKAPEPVMRRTSPAAIGVPGMVFPAIAELGPTRLNEYDVLVACALPSVAVASARIVRTDVIARTVVLRVDFFIHVYSACAG